MVTVRQRQLRFVGHVVRKGGLEKLVLEGKIDVRISRGRKRQNYMEGLALAAGCGTLDVLRRSSDRDGFRRLIANVSP